MFETKYATFSMEVLRNDKFQNLPPLAQLTYLYICAECDKDGFTNCVRGIARAYLGTDEYVQQLFDQGYIIELSDGDECLSKFKIVDFEQHNSGVKKSRECADYRSWRLAVLQEGNYECKVCGETENLVTHHIKPYKEFPELKHNVNNGVVLCVTCHKRAHKGGNK